MAAAVATVTTDDPDLRITRWTFVDDGDATGEHRHEFAYVVVPVTGGTFTVTEPGGASHDMTQVAASAYRGSAGTVHDVRNSSGGTAVFVEIEWKSQRKGLDHDD